MKKAIAVMLALLLFISIIGIPSMAEASRLRPRASFTYERDDLTVFFDASRSSRAAYYEWDFCDGTRTITRHPEVTHTYREPGRYRVSLTAWDRRKRRSDSVTKTIRVREPRVRTRVSLSVRIEDGENIEKVIIPALFMFLILMGAR